LPLADTEFRQQPVRNLFSISVRLFGPQHNFKFDKVSETLHFIEMYSSLSDTSFRTALISMFAGIL
jgi:hypothetical protein